MTSRWGVGLMAQARIEKTHADRQTAPNLGGYEAVYAAFDWETARRELTGLPAGKGLNMAFEAIDRHAEGPQA
ncbi:MAG: hypothetical protein U1F68_20740, partial [Gammaproteobacteria bacterium]